MKQNNRIIGTDYEKKAGEYLVSLGYRILAFNYRCKQGEIDIVAKDGEIYVFCEVKYRGSDRLGYPEESVDVRKQKRIIRSAMVYLKEHRLWDVPCRFDVVGVLGTEISHIKDAFDMSI